MGGCAAALLAFLAFRPRKGWLRRTAVASDKPTSLLPDNSRIASYDGQLTPDMDPGALSVLPASTSADESASLPLSYISTGFGRGSSFEGGGQASGGLSPRLFACSICVGVGGLLHARDVALHRRHGKGCRWC